MPTALQMQEVQSLKLVSFRFSHQEQSQLRYLSAMQLLCYFVHRHLDFRKSDVESVAKLMGCTGDRSTSWDLPFGGNAESPYWYLNVPDEAKAREIAERSVLMKVQLFEQILTCAFIPEMCMTLSALCNPVIIAIRAFTSCGAKAKHGKKCGKLWR